MLLYFLVFMVGLLLLLPVSGLFQDKCITTSLSIELNADIVLWFEKEKPTFDTSTILQLQTVNLQTF